MLNPYHLILELCSTVAEVKIPWSLTGALLMDVLVTLCTTAVLHPQLSPLQRLENALTSYVLFDLCSMEANLRCVDQRRPRGSIGLDAKCLG